MNLSVRNPESVDRHQPIGTRTISIGLTVVAACAVVLSFSALYDLAVLCGFGKGLAILVPVMVDAGAATASAVWLAAATPDPARRFARRLALALLFSTVAGNATAHALVAYHWQPHWVVIVLVGALAPAVLAATLRLRSLVNTHDKTTTDEVAALATVETHLVDEVAEPVAAPVVEPVVEQPTVVATTARDLVLAGVGRTRLMKELGLTDHQARQAIRAHRPTNGQVVA